MRQQPAAQEQMPVWVLRLGEEEEIDGFWYRM